MQSGGVPGSGSQGKDPLAPVINASRNMYQHPAVSGYNTQDTRGQSMPVSVRFLALSVPYPKCCEFVSVYTKKKRKQTLVLCFVL